MTTSIIAAQDEKFEGTIVINDEYESLVPSLSKEEFESIKQSIKEDELTYAIIVNQNGVILDGYQRYKACQELGKDLKLQVKYFDDPFLEQKFRIEVNMNRRHLTTFQRIELQYKLESIDAELAKKRFDMHLPKKGQKGFQPVSVQKNTDIGINSDTDTEKGRVIDLAAKKAHISPMTYFKGREIIKNSPEDIKEQLRKGKVKIDKVYKQLQNQQMKQELINSTPVLEFPNDNFKLVQGDFIEKSQEFISASSIDLLFTDPPYGSQFLSLYDNLATLATRVLKEGRSLITYVGNYALPQVVNTLSSAGLKYWWTIAVNLEGSFGRHHPRKVSIKWKPLLWFVKGDSTNTVDYMSDAINSNRPEKIMHEWEQPTIDAEHVISRLTVENQTILDPMMGSGTTGVAALKLKRKFIGIELDSGKFEIARARLSKINE